MRLSHITISGFKSFAKKTTLDVTHQVTGVVGPNGSGKSNIAEAIRFVLGEQSMKSMRGKIGSDVIFKGSEHLAPLSRASVVMVIDNREKRNTEHVNDNLAPFLVYDELTLARTIYKDGGSEYTLNDAKVRLKDVQELLSFAGIGGSTHTIISQGEGDKILLSNAKDRKEAIEDALGLRVYHMRLNESARKLDHVKVHVHEVEILRKEIKPHLAHLKRQVEKIELEEVERKKLHSFLIEYFKREDKELCSLRSHIEESGTSSALSLVSQMIEKELSFLRTQKSGSTEGEESREEIKRQREKDRLSSEVDLSLLKKDEISKTLGKLEAEKSHTESDLKKENEKSSITIETNELHVEHMNIKNGLSLLKTNIRENKQDEALLVTEDLSRTTDTFFQKHKHVLSSKKDNLSRNLEECLLSISEYEEKYRVSSENIASLRALISDLDTNFKKTTEDKYEEEKKIMLLESKLRELTSTIMLRKQEEGEVLLREGYYKSLFDEGRVIVGKILEEYKLASLDESLQGYTKQELMRQIERSKLRIEEAGVSDKDDVVREYTATQERDQYLEKELLDIKESEKKLLLLVEELTSTLKERFSSGVRSVSLAFEDFFGEMFPGGKARLSLVSISKLDEEGNETHEEGIDIDVSLPHKKIKELSMFSGGERALVSIALLFAMSSVTPPPFMVLDETDAPLDESNARKYGSILKKLSENSKLLVITHNRETMNHCDMLYGVTIGSDGGSKLLSINFTQTKNMLE